ncbi:MAG TPA: hypothetical protein VJJ98_02805 [Sedimentisphaerales bacterium]|nr:hypothetical protein [Sedimentisphaerales bacterium]
MSKAAQLLAAIVSVVSLSASSLGATINADFTATSLPETLLYAPERVVFELARPAGDYGGGWSFRCRLTKPDGAAIEGLRFVPE